MVPAAAVDGVIDELAPQLAAGRHADRRRQLALRRRRAARGRARRARHALPRRRHQRRHLGPRARLLPDDRRRRRGGDAARRRCSRRSRRATSAAPPTGGTAGRTATCTAARAAPGHFVKMVHNGIEYGLMAAYAEGFNLLEQANAGQRAQARRRRDRAADGPRNASRVRLRPGRDRGAVAPRQRRSARGSSI